MENDSRKNVESLLKRTYMFLEDKDFEKAIEYCERILDIDSENAEAYLGKLMAEVKICRLEDLQNLPELFNNSNDFQKVMRFADDDLKNKLSSYLQLIAERKEHERKEALFNSACEEQCNDTISSLEKAIEIFSSIIEWNNAEIRIAACKNRISEINAEKEEKRKKAEKQAEIERKETEERKRKTEKFMLIATPIVCAVIAFIIILNTSIIPNNRYNDGLELMKSGEYATAIVVFEKLEEYKDSKKLLADAKYNNALIQIEKENVIEAYETLTALDDYKDSMEKADSIYFKYEIEKLKQSRVGDYVLFGEYEQDNSISNGKENINWLVADKQNNKMFLISKNALDCQQYNSSDVYITWETCSLRRWLNDNFLNEAFSNEEKSKILTTYVSAEKNPKERTDPGNATNDKVFLLSISECEKYLHSDKSCSSTKYAAAKGADIGRDYVYYWLRTPGVSEKTGAATYNAASVVDFFGDINGFSNTCKRGMHVDAKCVAVRPVIWVDIS